MVFSRNIAERSGKNNVASGIEPGQFFKLPQLGLGQAGLQLPGVEFLQPSWMWRKVSCRVIALSTAFVAAIDLDFQEL